MSASADQDKTYNGWKSRETWEVNLWLGNVEPDYRAVTAMARAQLPDLDSGVLSIWQARLDLSEEIASYVSRMPRQAGLGADLLSAVLARVDWEEIAQGFLEAEDCQFGEEDKPCEACGDGAQIDDTCDTCGERHCLTCDPCEEDGEDKATLDSTGESFEAASDREDKASLAVPEGEGSPDPRWGADGHGTFDC